MRYKGNAASEGIAIGRVLQYRAYTAKVEKKEIDPGEIEQEKVRWRTACERAKEELRALCKTLEQTDPDKAAIFEAHQDIVQDVALEEDIVGEIEDGGCNAEWATAKIYDRYARRLEKAADERMRARAADLYDVKNRILRCCEGKAEKNLSALEQPVVVMAHDLFPSDTATLDRKNVLGIVTEVGGQTSHSAIIARSYGIPALLGVTGCMEQVQEGTQVCVDAVDGELITEPDAAYLAALQEKKAVFEQVREDTERYRREEGRTADGTRIEVELNVGDPNEKELSASAYTDGVGLFRTEFLYMGRRDLPDEDEQAEVYRRVLESFRGKPVILRTLDIGGDKKLESMQLPSEENPFLGNRALRLCLEHKEMFRTQLRACLRASVYGQLWLMFPMVGGLEDLRAAKEQLEQAKKELDARGERYSKDVKVGIMVEIPSAALIAEAVAAESDFASIGTNDLTQYTLAADRMSPSVSEYYRFYHPSLFRLIGNVATAYRRQGKPVSVCGEMGGDPAAAAALVGLGIRRLSLGSSSVPRIKKMLSKLRIEEMEGLAVQAQALSTEAEVRAMLQAAVQ